MKFGKPHTAVDYRGKPLKGVFIPLRKNGEWIECKGPQGGILSLKSGQLKEEETL